MRKTKYIVSFLFAALLFPVCGSSQVIRELGSMVEDASKVDEGNMFYWGDGTPKNTNTTYDYYSMLYYTDTDPDKYSSMFEIFTQILKDSKTKASAKKPAPGVCAEVSYFLLNPAVQEKITADIKDKKITLPAFDEGLTFNEFAWLTLNMEYEYYPENKAYYETLFKDRLSEYIATTDSTAYEVVATTDTTKTGATVSPTTASAKTRGSYYPKMYTEQPQRLVIMPPTNSSSINMDGRILYGVLFHSLSEKGYNVTPTMLTNDYFRGKGFTDSKTLQFESLSDVKDKYLADAVVFSDIKSCKKGVKTANADVHVWIKSTKTNEIIFDRYVKMKLDVHHNRSRYGREKTGKVLSGLGGSIFGTIGNIIIDTATEAAKTEGISDNVAPRAAIKYILSDLPCGKLSSHYGKDSSYKAAKPNTDRSDYFQSNY